MKHRFSSLVFWASVAFGSVVMFTAAVLIWLIFWPFDRDRRINHLCSCLWAAIYVYGYPGLHVRVRHRDKIRPRQAYVLVANHTSLADTAFCLTLFRQFKWVAKHDVLKIPLIGCNMRLCRYVVVKRGDAASVSQMMTTCGAWLRRGMSLMMFPEGTRSRDGQMLPFKLGPFTLALQNNVSVLPIAIHGGHQLLPKDGSVLARNVHVVIEVLEPIAPQGFADAAALAAAARQRIQDALDAHQDASIPMSYAS